MLRSHIKPLLECDIYVPDLFRSNTKQAECKRFGHSAIDDLSGHTIPEERWIPRWRDNDPQSCVLGLGLK